MDTVLVLATAVVTASVMGSMHCVGMCGPLAIWASGGGEQVGKRTMLSSTSLYHVGRLITYTIAGTLAGLIGSAVDLGGSSLGIQLLAARLVGAIMVTLGLIKLWRMGFASFSAATDTAALPAHGKPSAVGKVLAKIRPFVFRLPIPARALATGMLTTLLPCGWLYLFALIAAGTGSPFRGGVVMAAFWLGSVPALVALVAGVRMLSQRFTRLIPAAAATMLIVAGCFTASGRGFAGLASLETLKSDGDTLQQVEQADDKVLPCCRAHAAATNTATNTAASNTAAANTAAGESVDE